MLATSLSLDVGSRIRVRTDASIPDGIVTAVYTNDGEGDLIVFRTLDAHEQFLSAYRWEVEAIESAPRRRSAPPTTEADPRPTINVPLLLDLDEGPSTAAEIDSAAGRLFEANRDLSRVLASLKDIAARQLPSVDAIPRGRVMSLATALQAEAGELLAVAISTSANERLVEKC